MNTCGKREPKFDVDYFKQTTNGIKIAKNSEADGQIMLIVHSMQKHFI
ncbi:MAG: hypothetical protein PHW90_04470 [Bacilli bacterium]|nr:hypothetical protein [Bacilli bacterium]